MIYYDRIEVSGRIDFNKKKVHQKSLMFVTLGIF